MTHVRKMTFVRDSAERRQVQNGFNEVLPEGAASLIPAPNGVAAGMLVHDGVLYCSHYGTNEILSYDLSDPMNPALIHRWDTTDTQPRWFEVHDNILVCLCRGVNTNGKIQFWDITNATSPTLTASFTPDHGLPKEFIIRDGHILITHAESEDPGTFPVPWNGLAKWSITLPTNGRTLATAKVGEVQTIYAKFAMSMCDNGVAVLGGAGPMINVINTNDTMASLFEGNFSDGRHAGTAVSNNFVSYVANDVDAGPTSEIDVVDLTDPTTPTIISTVTLDFPAEASSIVGEMFIIGNRLYCICGRHAVDQIGYLCQVDISNPRAPEFLGYSEIDTGGAGFAGIYTIDGNSYVYVNGHFSPYNIVSFEVRKLHS